MCAMSVDPSLWWVLETHREVLSHMIHFCDELHYTSCIHVMCLSFARLSCLLLFIPHFCAEWYTHRWMLSHMIHHCDALHYTSSVDVVCDITHVCGVLCLIIVMSNRHTDEWCHTWFSLWWVTLDIMHRCHVSLIRTSLMFVVMCDSSLWWVIDTQMNAVTHDSSLWWITLDIMHRCHVSLICTSLKRDITHPSNLLAQCFIFTCLYIYIYIYIYIYMYIYIHIYIYI